MGVRILTKAIEEETGTVIESFFNDTEHKMQLASKSVVQEPFQLRSEIAHILAAVDILTRTDVKAIFESWLKKPASTRQSEIVKVFKYTFRGRMKNLLFELEQSPQICDFQRG